MTRQAMMTQSNSLPGWVRCRQRLAVRDRHGRYIAHWGYKSYRIPSPTTLATPRSDLAPQVWPIATYGGSLPTCSNSYPDGRRFTDSLPKTRSGRSCGGCCATSRGARGDGRHDDVGGLRRAGEVARGGVEWQRRRQQREGVRWRVFSSNSRRCAASRRPGRLRGRWPRSRGRDRSGGRLRATDRCRARTALPLHGEAIWMSSSNVRAVRIGDPPEGASEAVGRSGSGNLPDPVTHGPCQVVGFGGCVGCAGFGVWVACGVAAGFGVGAG